MTRAKISEYSATANDNTDVNGINIAEGCPPSSMNNMGREIMAALKRFQVGSDGDGVTVGGSLVVSGSTTVNTFNVDVISEKTSAAGVTVDGVLLKDSQVSTDQINEKTSATGVTIDGVLLKDSGLVTGAGTVSAPVYSTTGDLNTGIFFPAADTIAFAEGGAEVARFDSSGKFGVGTTSPGFLIHASQSSSSGSGGAYPAVVVRNTNTSTTSISEFRTQANNTTIDGSFASILDSGDSFIRFGALSNHPVTFYTNSAERARITNGGNFLWGATTLAGVSGADAKGIDYPDGMRLFSSRASTAAREHVIFYNPNGDVGSIDTTGSATAYNTSSDYRLKENISPLTNAISTISQLKPSTWTWKVDGSAGQGFVAHELQEVIPDCVTGEKDEVETYTDEEGIEQTRPKYQGVDTSFLVATLTAAIQELKAINDAQASRIETLEAKVAALENA